MAKGLSFFSVKFETSSAVFFSLGPPKWLLKRGERCRLNVGVKKRVIYNITEKLFFTLSVIDYAVSLIFILGQKG